MRSDRSGRPHRHRVPAASPSRYGLIIIVLCIVGILVLVWHPLLLVHKESPGTVAAPSVNEAPPADTLQVSATIALFFTPSLSLSLSVSVSVSLSLSLPCTLTHLRYLSRFACRSWRSYMNASKVSRATSQRLPRCFFRHLLKFRVQLRPPLLLLFLFLLLYRRRRSSSCRHRRCSCRHRRSSCHYRQRQQRCR